MKRLKTVLALCAVASTAAFAQTSFTLTGNIPEEHNGKTVYLVLLDGREKIDSTVVTSGKVSLKANLDTDARPGALMIDGRRRANFIIENGAAVINEDGVVSGTPLNDISEATAKKVDDAYTRYKNEYRAVMTDSTLTDEAKKNLLEVKYEEVIGQLDTIILNVYQENKTNPVGYMFFSQLAEGMTIAEIDSLLDGAAQWIKDSKMVGNIKHIAQSLEITAEGKMFTDFAVKMSNGKTVRLSDYVGKGDYVVLDFFASWCGPCMREMPTIRAIYDKYEGKGLKVIGLAVWDDPADTRRCVEEKQLPWTIIDNAQEVPGDIYGVQGIPHLIIFAPDGTIHKRGLRGDELIAEIDRLMNK